MQYFWIVFFISSSLYARPYSLNIVEEFNEQNQTQTPKETPLLQENNSTQDFEDTDDFFDEEDEDDAFYEEFSDTKDAFTEEEIFDPLSGYNRWMTGVNHSLMINVIDPAATGYDYVVPGFAQQGVNNFFNNLYYPVSLFNNILQFEIIDSSTETVRFLINTTIGIFGLFDPADAWFEIKMKQEDFGQTLGFYGVGSGFPVVLPFFGQRNLRDITGIFVDGFVDPLNYVNGRFYNTVQPYWQSVIIIGYDDFNEYSLTPGAYPELTKDTIDLYPFMRDAYEQYRNQLIEE